MKTKSRMTDEKRPLVSADVLRALTVQTDLRAGEPSTAPTSGGPSPRPPGH